MLPNTEAEYVLLSLALRDQILLMELMKELIMKVIDVKYQPPHVYCTAFEHHNEAVELVQLPTICPQSQVSEQLLSSFSIIYCWTQTTN